MVEGAAYMRSQLSGISPKVFLDLIQWTSMELLLL